MPHRNIPIFIPHLGCPNQCVFCNQHAISGCHGFDETEVRKQLEAAFADGTNAKQTEIAFFGGSFTGIDRGLMIRLLELAETYVRGGLASSIRLSTRPDYINDNILEILSRYSVRTVELGLQSMSDRVLEASRRGHDAQCARLACRAVKAAGFSLVGQMMVGLPKSTEEDEIETAQEIAALGADAARIYPTVVFYQTPLSEAARTGEYTPLTTQEAVLRTASVLRTFRAHDVPCIRIGLCATEDLVSPEAVMAGPNHPALGELVWNEVYYQDTVAALQQAGLCGRDVELAVPTREISKVVGQHRSNLTRLLRETDTRVRKIVGKEGLSTVVPYPWHGQEKKQEEQQLCI